jgi:hypothetical protein
MLIALLLHVALEVPPNQAMSPGIIRSAVVEAAGLWAPYGVEIDLASGPGHCGDILTVVPIETRHAAETPGWRGALGAIAFAPDGAPIPAITLYVTDIEHFVVAARLFSAFGRFWPQVLREQLLGRVLGRVLAHEIGHYVLRSPRHATEGLMRPLQFADDLISPTRHRFTLTAADAARLEGQR